MAQNINIKSIVGTLPEIEEIDRNLIWKYFNLFSMEGMEVKEGEHPFKINGANGKIIQCVLRYFSGSEDFNEFNIVSNNASLHKGLLIFGQLGVGKSKLMNTIQKAGREIIKETGNPRMHFDKISCGNFVTGYMAATKKDHLNFNVEKYYNGRLYIDDLGIEPKAFNSYELMESVLFERHMKGATTFITTNLFPYQISERYGPRIGDRLNEMFNFIEWKGESFRKSK